MARYPSLFQINTRVWLTGLSALQGRKATLDDIPNAELDRWAELGFDWIWIGLAVGADIVGYMGGYHNRQQVPGYTGP